MTSSEHSSKASISRMPDYLRRDVTEWLERSLESYNPVVFIDCVHIMIHRKRSVDTEAFYVLLHGKEDKTRKVLDIYNKTTESTLAGERCSMTFTREVSQKSDLYARMVSRDLVMLSVRHFPALVSRDAPPT